MESGKVKTLPTIQFSQKTASESEGAAWAVQRTSRNVGTKRGSEYAD